MIFEVGEILTVQRRQERAVDPVTIAILTAVSTTVAQGAGQAVGENVVTDIYARLKQALVSKFGRDSDVLKSVEDLEAKPDSNGRKETLKEEVEASEAGRDPEIRKIAQELLDAMAAQPGGEQHIQNAEGNFIAQADRNSNAQVRVNRTEEYDCAGTTGASPARRRGLLGTGRPWLHRHSERDPIRARSPATVGSRAA